MHPKRYSVKIFIQNPAAVHLPALIPIFQRWIQTHAIEGLLIDLADYKHVHHGPGVILIGYEGDYALDTADGRPGLRYTRKRELPASLKEGLRETFRLALAASRALENDPALDESLSFHPGEIELAFLDRLNTPNTPETFQALQPAITRALSDHFPDGTFTLEPDFFDSRRPLTVRITAIPEYVSN
jgi:hypothetical protein